MVRNSVFFFAALALVAIAGFWPSYVSRVGAEPDIHIHFHALVMTAWLALLLAQASLIRAGRRSSHRALGKVSFVLVPLIVLSTLSLARHRMAIGPQPLTEETVYFHYVVLSLLAVFVYAYVQAIRHRRSPLRHGAYMACTALALIDPIGARLLYNHLGIGPPLMQVYTYLLTDAILFALLLRERRLAGPGPRVFPGMLALFVLVQAPTFFIASWPPWRAFTESFARFPVP